MNCLHVLVVVLLLHSPCVALGEQCAAARRVGSLDPRVLPEASGMAASAAFPGRLYFINDGGNGPYFFVTDMQGRIEQSIRMAGVENEKADYEAMSLGPCSGAKSCLFIGDIGDNHAKRTHVDLLIFEELENFPSTAAAFRRVTLTYPDGPHDAEGLAVRPNGDVYILTKGMDYEAQRAWPSKLFLLRRRQWEQGEGAQTMTLVGDMDLARIVPSGSGLRSLAATGMDFAPDGSRLVVLTYADAFEFPFESEAGVVPDRARRIELQPLRQQECITYLPNGTSLLYTTESTAQAPAIMRVDCDGSPNLDEGVDRTPGSR